MLAPGSQLAQVQGSSTASLLYAATIRTEVKSIKIANTTGATSKFRLFHDDDGTTYSSATCLYWDVPVTSGQTLSLDAEYDGGINVAKNGNLGFRCDVSQALTVTVYGVVQQVR